MSEKPSVTLLSEQFAQHYYRHCQLIAFSYFAALFVWGCYTTELLCLWFRASSVVNHCAVCYIAFTVQMCRGQMLVDDCLRT